MVAIRGGELPLADINLDIILIFYNCIFSYFLAFENIENKKGKVPKPLQF